MDVINFNKTLNDVNEEIKKMNDINEPKPKKERKKKFNEIFEIPKKKK